MFIQMCWSIAAEQLYIFFSVTGNTRSVFGWLLLHISSVKYGHFQSCRDEKGMEEFMVRGRSGNL